MAIATADPARPTPTGRLDGPLPRAEGPTRHALRS